MPKVKCEWDTCKSNKDGYCTKDEIELVDVVVPGGSLMDCKTFEWAEEE
jgi:hypothetical protein